MDVIDIEPGPTSLVKSWAVQRRVIFALLMRETLTRFGRHNIGFLWLFVEPMIFTLGVTTLWTLTQALHGSNLPIAVFAVTGYSSVLLWRNMPGRLIGSIEPNLSLMYHRNVKVIDIFAARLLLEFAGVSTSFVVLSIFFISIGWFEPPEDILKVFMGWLMLTWVGFSLAILLGALQEFYEIVEKLFHPATYLMFPLSGAAFLVEALPDSAQKIILFLPMVHGVELVRDGYFGSQFKAVYDLPYMVAVCSVMSLSGLVLLRKVSRKVTPQ